MASKQIRKVSDLTPDKRNANRGTERGRSLLEHSLRTYGTGRSILVDKNGHIIAGNKTAEEAVDVGLEDVIVVPSDGKKLIVVQRTDLDLTKDKTARELAIADNRVGQLDLDWSADELLALKNDGIDMKSLGFYDEDILNLPWPEHWKEMPEFAQEDQRPFRTIFMHFRSERSLKRFAELVNQSVTDKTKYLWYPRSDGKLKPKGAKYVAKKKAAKK